MTKWDVKPAGQFSASHKSRLAEIMTTYQVQWPCQKVSECLYITLPSYNMYLITFWHNSALAFILGWWDDQMRCQAGRPVLGQPQISAGRDHGNLSGAVTSKKVNECLYVILPSYNMYSITFWHNSALAFILGWWPYEMSSRPASSLPATNLGRFRFIMATYQVQWPCQKVSECYISSCHPIICI